MPSAQEWAKEQLKKLTTPSEEISRPKSIVTSTVIPGVDEFDRLKAKYPKIESLGEGQHVEYFYTNPSQFIIDVHGAWTGLTRDQEKKEYLKTIHDWILKNVDPNDYQHLFPKVAWNWVWWFINHVTPEHGEYGHMIYIQNDIAGFIKDASTAIDTLPEDQRESYRETIKKYLDQWAPAGFAQTLPADLQNKFVTKFFPAELAAVSSAQVTGISTAKFIGLAVMGVIGIGVLSLIGRGKKSAKGKK